MPAPRQNINLSLLGLFLCVYLVTHKPYCMGGGAYEFYRVLLAHLGKGGAFRKESVSRMHRIGIHNLNRAYQRRYVQIALGTLCRPYAYCAVGNLYVERFLIHVGIDRDRLYAKFLARPYDSQGYFASIGNKYLVEHKKPAF